MALESNSSSVLLALRSKETFVQPSVLRLKSVIAITGLGRSTIYMYIAKGIWTTPVRLGPHAVGWPESEVHELMRARIAGSSEEGIRRLVSQLHVRRNSA